MRGAWVEIVLFVYLNKEREGRSPCGERGLKFVLICLLTVEIERRSPCGERGLK